MYYSYNNIDFSVFLLYQLTPEPKKMFAAKKQSRKQILLGCQKIIGKYYFEAEMQSSLKTNSNTLYGVNTLFHLKYNIIMYRINRQHLDPFVFNKISYKIMFANMSLYLSRWYRRAAFPQEAIPPKTHRAGVVEHFQI